VLNNPDKRNQTDAWSSRLPADCVLWDRDARAGASACQLIEHGDSTRPIPLFCIIAWQNPLTLHQNPLNVHVTPLPLNFRSFGGSKTRICSSLDMFLAGKVMVGSGGQSQTLPLSHTVSAPAARVRSAFPRGRAGRSVRVLLIWLIYRVFFFY